MELITVIAKVLQASSNQEVVDAQDVVNNLHLYQNVWRYAGTKVDDAAMTQLVRERLGGIPAVITDESLGSNLRMDYIRQKAAALPAHNLLIRSRETVRAFLPEASSEFTNANIAKELNRMYNDGLLPEDTTAHRFWITDDQELFLRLISKQWNLGPYFGGLAISNRELKEGMKVRPGVAKVSCFNWVLSESTLRPEDREAVRPALETGLRMISTFAQEGIMRMSQMEQVKISNIQTLFELIASQLKLPENVKSEMYKYWVKNGSGRTPFDVVQAVTFGSQALTDNTGRRKPRWFDRDTLEEAVWGWSGEVMAAYSSGADLDEMISNRELVSKSRVLEGLRTQDDPERYIRALPAAGFSK